MQNQKIQLLCQFIQSSSQPSLLVEISNNKIIASNTQLTKLLALKSNNVQTSDLFQKIMEKAHSLIDKNQRYFNYEIYIEDTIFIILAEVNHPYLVICLQEKFNYNMPSNHLINILDSLGAYVYCKDLNSKYTYANKMLEELFGQSNNGLIGSSNNDYPGFKYANNDIDTLVINSEQCIEQEEVLFIEESNETRTFLSVKSPLYGKHNKVVGLFGISTDISEYKATEKKLNTILDNVAAYIYIRSINHQFIYVNEMTKNLFQLSIEEIKGKTPIDLLGDINGHEFQRLDLELLRKKDRVEGVETFINGNDTLYFWTVKAPLYDDEGNITSFIGMSTDITKQIRLEKESEKANKELKIKIEEITELQKSLWEQATQDPLTQLFNRRYFNENSEKEIIKAERNNKPLSLLLLDADYFKKVNDKFGHDIGDKVLIKVAKIMIGECRRSDIVCRYGGEEFVILMPEASIEIAFDRAEKIRLRYQKEISEFLNTPSTISIGIATWDSEFEDIEGFTKAADQAMYQAKENGRNQVAIYNSKPIK